MPQSGEFTNEQRSYYLKKYQALQEQEAWVKENAEIFTIQDVRVREIFQVGIKLTLEKNQHRKVVLKKLIDSNFKNEDSFPTARKLLLEEHEYLELSSTLRKKVKKGKLD